MSIIQEALKKAERHIKNPKQTAAQPRPLQPDSGVASSAQAPSSSSPEQSSVMTPRPIAGSDPKAVAILIVILLVTAVFAASQLFPKKDIPAKSSIVAVAAKSEELPALPSVIFQQVLPQSQQQEEEKPASPEFVLNGIMYLEGNPRAIINDVMVEVGDMVGGARVLKIEKKSVLLQYDDAEINLDLK